MKEESKQELVRTVSQLKDQSNKLDQAVLQKLKIQERVCYTNSLQDPDFFVKCMANKRQKISEEIQILHYKKLFTKFQLYFCYDNEPDHQKCRQKAKQSIEKAYDQLDL